MKRATYRSAQQVTICILLLCVGAAAGAQSATTPARSRTEENEVRASPAFEIVSIRPDTSMTPGHEQIVVTPDGWHMAHAPLIAALLAAYVPTRDAMMFTVSTLVGVPDWLESEMYDIDAKVSDADRAAWQNPATQTAMLRTMMQAMLAERCRLATHRGAKEVKVFSLTIAKGGPRLKEAIAGEPHPGAVSIPVGGTFLANDGTGNASFYNAPVSALAVVLSNFAGRPVVDHTGLTGRYDMSFRRPTPGAPPTEDEANPPPTVSEVAQSFGMKLEPAKSSVETLVIDHVEKPTAN